MKLIATFLPPMHVSFLIHVYYPFPFTFLIVLFSAQLPFALLPFSSFTLPTAFEVFHFTIMIGVLAILASVLAPTQLSTSRQLALLTSSALEWLAVPSFIEFRATFISLEPLSTVALSSPPPPPPASFFLVQASPSTVSFAIAFIQVVVGKLFFFSRFPPSDHVVCILLRLGTGRKQMRVR